jgi:hypothetical protein
VRHIEYPQLPEGSASPAVKKAIRDLVDQVNAALSEMEKLYKGGIKNGN